MYDDEGSFVNTVDDGMIVDRSTGAIVSELNVHPSLQNCPQMPDL